MKESSKTKPREYDVNELYKKRWLETREVAFLLGMRLHQSFANIYKKMDSGQLPYEVREDENGAVRRVVKPKALYQYILRKRKESFEYAESLKLPTKTIDWK